MIKKGYKLKNFLFATSIIIMVLGSSLIKDTQMDRVIGGALIFFGALLMLKTDTRDTQMKTCKNESRNFSVMLVILFINIFISLVFNFEAKYINIIIYLAFAINIILFIIFGMKFASCSESNKFKSIQQI